MAGKGDRVVNTFASFVLISAFIKRLSLKSIVSAYLFPFNDDQIYGGYFNKFENACGRKFHFLKSYICPETTSWYP